MRAFSSIPALFFKLYHLRHTFATRLRAANVHAYDIADLLAHSVPERKREEHASRVATRTECLKDSATQSTLWKWANGRFWRVRHLYAMWGKKVSIRASEDARELLKMWRRGWDLNPRWGFPHSGFRDRCTKPLCDLSAGERIRAEE